MDRARRQKRVRRLHRPALKTGELLRQEQGPARHRVFSESRERDDRPGLECVHNEAAQSSCNTFFKRIAEKREAAAEDDDFGVTKVDHVGEAKGEVFSGFGEDFSGEWIAFLQGRGEMAGFTAGGALQRLVSSPE